MTLASGTRIGSYEITAEIGKGGMGEVYRARDAKLARFWRARLRAIGPERNLRNPDPIEG